MSRKGRFGALNLGITYGRANLFWIHVQNKKDTFPRGTGSVHFPGLRDRDLLKSIGRVWLDNRGKTHRTIRFHGRDGWRPVFCIWG